MQQASYSNIDPINMLSSQKHLSTKTMQSIHRSKTHTHTHTLNKSNQFYISKTSWDSLVSIQYHMYPLWWPNHIVPAHVSKVVKNLRGVCENIARVHKCLIFWGFEIWENQYHSHTIITAWWGLSPLRYIL